MSNFQTQVQNKISSLPDSVKNVTEYIGDTAQSIGKNYTTAKDNVSSTLSSFNDKASAGLAATPQFLNSNTIIAKFAFVILVIILFLFFLGLGVNAVQYLFSSGKDPYIIKGMISGNDSQVIAQDPLQRKAVTLQRSNNEKTGMEFTWSVWLYVAEVNNNTQHQHIFNKGDRTYDTTGVAINNGPGLYIKGKEAGTAPSTLSLVVFMDTASNTEKITIPEIPIKKWVNVIIRLENLMMDIYINGIIKERKVFPNVPKQNYYDILICQNNAAGSGFNGNLSNLRYYNKALSAIQINNIVYWGPNTKASKSVATTKGGFDYLSSTWYTGLGL
jgi:hypothetical protein